MSQSPRLEEVIAAGIQDRLEAFWTSIACVVVSYDATSQKAVVRPVTVASWIDGSGTEHDPDHPSLYDVPVVFPGGKSADGKAFRITFPISPGDGGVLIVSTLPTQGWSETGALQVVDLEVSQAGRNSLSCGYFVPGLGSKSVATQAPTDALVVWGDKVKIGGDTGTEPTFKADTFLARFNAFLAVIETEINAISGGVAGTTIRDAWIATGIKTSNTEVK